MVFDLKPAMMEVLTGFSTGSPVIPRLNVDGTLTIDTEVGTITFDADETQLLWDEFVKRQARLWPVARRTGGARKQGKPNPGQKG